MNGPKDFAELKVSETQRRYIALMLGLWNSADESGHVTFDYSTVTGNYSDRQRLKRRASRAAKQLGLKLR